MGAKIIMVCAWIGGFSIASPLFIFREYRVSFCLIFCTKLIDYFVGKAMVEFFRKILYRECYDNKYLLACDYNDDSVGASGYNVGLLHHIVYKGKKQSNLIKYNTLVLVGPLRARSLKKNQNNQRQLQETGCEDDVCSYYNFCRMSTAFNSFNFLPKSLDETELYQRFPTGPKSGLQERLKFLSIIVNK